MLIPAVLSLIAIVFIVRLPADELNGLWAEILDKTCRWYYVGPLSTLLIAFLWYRSSKGLRRVNAKEMNRLGEEKVYWQNIALDKKLGTSKQR